MPGTPATDVPQKHLGSVPGFYVLAVLTLTFLGCASGFLGTLTRQIAALELRAEPWHEGFSKWNTKPCRLGLLQKCENSALNIAWVATFARTSMRAEFGIGV